MSPVNKGLSVNKMSVCFTPDLLFRVSKYQRIHNIINFSEAVRELVEEGLEKDRQRRSYTFVKHLNWRKAHETRKLEI